MQHSNPSRPEGTSPRYGTDELYRFILWVCIVLALFRLFVRGIWGYILLIGIGLLMGFSVFRSLSRNHGARQAENRAYLLLRRRLWRFLRLQYRRLTDREAVYRVCPECRAIMRLPRRSGDSTVKCPRCGEEFDIHIR